jgi:hypothetical protein
MCGWLVWVLLLDAATNPDLEAAQKAAARGQYQEVLPFLAEANKGTLTDAERVQSLELEAKTLAAFGRKKASVDAFRRLMGVNSDYRPPKSTSPKLRAMWKEAVELGPIGQPAAAPEAPPARLEPSLPSPRASEPPTPSLPAIAPMLTVEPAPKTPESPKLYERWWFWTAVGVVAAAGAGGAYYLMVDPHLPRSNLGSGTLP